MRERRTMESLAELNVRKSPGNIAERYSKSQDAGLESRQALLEAAGEGTKIVHHPSPGFRPRLSLFNNHLRTVLAVKGSLRRAQQRRALDGSGPFLTKSQ